MMYRDLPYIFISDPFLKMIQGHQTQTVFFEKYVEGDASNFRLINHLFRTLSSHFFHVNIDTTFFTEIQTIILKC